MQLSFSAPTPLVNILYLVYYTGARASAENFPGGATKKKRKITKKIKK